MHVDVRQVDDVVIVDLQGKLVAGVGDVLLREVMNELVAEDWKKILLNLERVSGIDSSGIGELVASLKLAKRFGVTLKVCKPDNGVEHVLTISQILPLFDVFPDEESALARFAESA